MVRLFEELYELQELHGKEITGYQCSDSNDAGTVNIFICRRSIPLELLPRAIKMGVFKAFVAED